ncbi:PAS domain-containing protein [Phormidesmis sp. 146-33]
MTPTHPFILTLESLRNQGAILQDIILTPLTLESLSQLLAETLNHTPETVHSLVQTVARKTEGNPFFVGEFLKLLYDENLLTFDAQQLRWQWSLAEIDAQDITDNVVELLLHQLQKLSEATQQILSIAACVGSEFDLETLAIVCEESPKAISLNLLAAIQAELIQPLSELDENLFVQAYKFSHDRVQQAAYALIDESHKQVVHLQIGRNLLEKTLPEQRLERLFEIVDHLNHGIEIVSDQAKRHEIARLNLMAGQKAKGAIAYSTASNYLTTGRQWLEASSWQTNYDLTLALSVETTEVAYLCGEFEQVEDWAAIVLQEAKTVLETVKVYEVKIQIDMAQNQPLKAINTGLQVLQQLGISFPQSPTQLDVRLELDTITSLLGEKPIWDLIHLPKMTDPDKLAAMRILASLTAAAHIVAPNLLPLLASKQVNLSIQYGNAPVSPFAYASFGSILCGMVEAIESGYEFGQLALELLSQLNTHSIRARTLLFANFFIIHRKKHARELQQSFLEAYQSALEIGDLEFAAYSAHAYCRYCWAIGKGLVELEREMTTYSEAIHQLKNKGTLIWNQIDHQSVLNLMGRSISPTCLVGEIYNEEQGLSQYEAANVGNAIFSVSFNKLFLCYLFSEYAKAVENLALAERYLIQAISGPFEPLYYLYDSLVRLATHSESNAQVREEILEKVAISQEKMKRWADHAPMNYLHKYHLVEAEKARVLGQLLEAEKFYEQAIQGARENEYIQEEALAYELAAKHYLARGLEKFAQLYMKEAHYCYERWGAMAKVKDLETRYPQFFPQSSDVTYTPIHATSGITSTRLDSAFDLATVLKASQAISSEIELDRLLRSLMQILIENAGAQTGSLILENSGEWTIEAACELNDSENVCTTQVLESMPMANRLPESIIQYVIRTHEPVILNDATHEGNFIHEPYIQHNQPRSLLCLPLLNQSRLVGVLYLENKSATGAFTPEQFSEGDATRTQVLNLLSTQAAISIENAKLYSKLRTSESRMAQFLEAVPVGIGIVDAVGRPYYSNQRGIQLMGKGIAPAVTPDQFAEVYQLYLAGTDQKYPIENLPIMRALSGDCTTVDNIEIHQNNATTPIEVWGTPIFDEQGNIIYAIVAFQDITERKQAEKLLADYNRTLEQQVAERTVALQASETKFRNIFENSQVGIYRSRLSDRLLLDANQRFANLYGFDSPEEIIGIEHTADYYVNPSDRQQFLELLKRDGEVRNFEAQMRKRDGTLFWVLFSSYLNAADGYIEGVVVDISDCKRAEVALQTSEERLRLALTAANQGLYDTNIKTEEIVVNSEYASMFGYDPATLHTTKNEWIESVHPDDRESVVAAYHACTTEEVPNYQAEFRQRTQDGQWKWILSVGKVVTWNESGEPIRALGVYTDIDDRKQAEAVLRQSEAQFREQAILSAFRADVDSALAQSDSLPLMLHRCAEAVVKYLNAAFARIWTINKDQNVLELQASAGMYTRLDGTYSRVSMNSPKLGRIAQEGFPLLINNVFDESFVDQEWAEREGIVAFAGYPILLDEQLVGVIAMFARQSIPVSHCEALGFAAREMALGIKRKQAEAALQNNEERLRLALTAANQGLYDLDLRTEERIVNPEYALMLGYDPATSHEPISEWIARLHPDDRESVVATYRAYIAGEIPTYQAEYRQRTQDGQWKWTLSVGKIVAWDESGQPTRMLGTHVDINDRKRAEEASILEERNRMAREIHDTLAQAFTGILIQVDAATQVLTDDAEATLAHLDTIEELARTGLTEARRSVTALRPQLLEEGDLSSALERLVNQMRVATNTDLIYSIQGVAYSLPAEVENNLLRIGQEALTNAIKYANANEIRIELVYDNAQCRLQVKDDGQGFGVVGVPMSGGFGLLGMSERAERIGAQLAIESQPGQGTEIIVIVNRG